jgi:prephenate dehydratase
MENIAIQGYEGSFHHEAAIKYFGNNINIVPCANFRILAKKTQQDKYITGAIMAIENSIAGSILPNYALLKANKLKVVGELYLYIAQQLLANYGVKIEDLKEVHSHPMALLQCTQVIDQLRLKAVETDDTALSAKHIAQYKTKHTAAVASKLAAKLYNLNIIKPNIQDVKNNYTRFLVLRKWNVETAQINLNKASLYFKTNHQVGSLHKVLQIIAEADINVTKLQSAPILETPFKYLFYADVTFNEVSTFNNTMHAIKTLTDELNIYGIYTKADKQF